MVNLSIRKTGLFIVFLCQLESPSTFAQVTPDGTVNSQVTLQGNIIQIDGGTTRGSNLFHSFQGFSVPTGRTALFNNQASIQNIISRVTGNSASEIDGILKANHANLFFLNPNGIIFGKNARLDIGGSFLGTTADSIKFADGTQFSATNPQSSNLLTIATPIGLGFVTNSGEIRVSNSGHKLRSALFTPTSRDGNPPGLQVTPGKTLALIGGDVFLDGGAVYAPGGRLEVGSVKQGQVGFDITNPQWSFNYNSVSTFSDITLSNRSLLDASGQGNASLGIFGRRITFQDHSVALMLNQGVSPDKELKLEATESIHVSGNSLIDKIPVGVYSATLNTGSGAPITLISPSITIRDGGLVDALTFSPAKGGDIKIEARDSLKIDGTSPVRPQSVTSIHALSFGPGATGDVHINTSKLILSNAGRLSSITFDEGSGGDISINADLIEVFGTEPVLQQGSVIQAGTLGTGNAGSLKIYTSKLLVANGGTVSVTTLNSGDGGSLTINARDYIEVRGDGPDALRETIITAEAFQERSEIRSFLNLPPVPSGDAGSMSINTPRLLLRNGGQISVRNEGMGNAGDLKISANTITLEDNSLISATTFGGQGGNITLNAFLILLRDSSISASATKQGKGGNISAIATFVVALGESSLTAEAEKGQGGDITIAGKAVFLGPEVEVSVSSDAGLQASGTFRVVVEEQNFGETTAPAPDVNKAPKIISACNPSTGPSQFVVKGPGALKVQTRSIGPSSLVWHKKRSTTQIPAQSDQVPMDAPKSLSMVEAEGWQKIEDGRVKLIGPPPGKKTHLTAANPACSTPSS